MARMDPGVMEPVAEAELISVEGSAEEEQTKEEILEGIRLGFKEALAGETRPLDEVIKEVRLELEQNADIS